MGLFDLFSKRQRRARGEVPDVYQYEEIPDKLRNQIVHIWMETLGTPQQWGGGAAEAWPMICKILCREYGVFSLSGGARQSSRKDSVGEVVNFFLQVKDVEQALDVIELTFKVIDSSTRRFDYMNVSNPSDKADEAILELNTRFKEHGVGFQYESQEIIRVDSQFLHSEVVKPALQLLADKAYAGAQDEFLKAHEHYRHGHGKESLNECLKAFESMMKIICAKRGWVLAGNETASSLIKICLEKELIPVFWQTQFNSLKSLLEASVPTGRNKLAGHGQGEVATTVPDYLVAYMLHMTGACLVFLASAEAAIL
ncbi:hypothetical protein [Pseudomonas sp. dw_358]|uniref:STM4504/CBY_0614 family protein n=1 Tax=Pseudomonas sp. dw_358 TaxID=2720083 RepID=UPI001BD4CFDB|nr:hypothetical protein [Pseudomonas sp. dw_358]